MFFPTYFLSIFLVGRRIATGSKIFCDNSHSQPNNVCSGEDMFETAGAELQLGHTLNYGSGPTQHDFDTGTIDFNTLTTGAYDIFFSGSMKSSLTPTEIQALTDFIDVYDGVVVLTVVVDSITSYNEFLLPYGLQIGTQYAGPVTANVNPTLTTSLSCIMTGVTTVAMEGVHTIVATNGATYLQDPTETYLAMAATGNIIIIGDMGLFTDSDVNENANIAAANNNVLFENVFNFVPRCGEPKPPTLAPSLSPTIAPTVAPSEVPTETPTQEPTESPTETPTLTPTGTPTLTPTEVPTQATTQAPTESQTEIPTSTPTGSPTPQPTPSPIPQPTISPGATAFPVPTTIPTAVQTYVPTAEPTVTPTPRMTTTPTPELTAAPTAEPTELEDLPGIGSCDPFVVPFRGGVQVQCRGYNFQYHMTVEINDMPVRIDVDPESSVDNISSNAIYQLGYFSVFNFTAPGWNSSHEGGLASIDLLNPDGTSLSIMSALVYGSYEASIAACLTADFWWDGKHCVDCPRGGICPGGDVVVPMQGYWSENAHVEPLECGVPRACTGVDCGGDGDKCELPLRCDNKGRKCIIMTMQCNGREGYTGYLCTNCTDKFYKDDARCRSCLSETGETTRFTILLLVAIAFMIAIATMIVILDDHKLAYLVGYLIAIQQLLSTGNQASSELAKDEANFFKYTSFLYFEIDFVQAGCTVSAVSYYELLGATILVILTYAATFIIAAFLRHQYIKRREDSGHEALGLDAEKGFAWRARHSLYILGSIAHLQVLITAIEGLNCPEIGGVLRLKSAPDVRCYIGAHLPVAIFLWIVLIFYCVGFPVSCYANLHNHNKLKKVDLEYHKARSYGKYGYLIRGLKPQFNYFRVSTFIINFGICISSMAGSITSKLVTSALMFSCYVTFVGILLPFEKWYDNTFYICIGSAAILQALSLITGFQIPFTSQSDSLGANRDTALALTIAGLLVPFVVIVLYRIYLKMYGDQSDMSNSKSAIQMGDIYETNEPDEFG